MFGALQKAVGWGTPSTRGWRRNWDHSDGSDDAADRAWRDQNPEGWVEGPRVTTGQMLRRVPPRYRGWHNRYDHSDGPDDVADQSWRNQRREEWVEGPLARGDAVRIALNREKRTKAATAVRERRAREQRERDYSRGRSDSGEGKEYEHTEGSWARRLPAADSTRFGVGQERDQDSADRSQDDRARRLRDQARKTKAAATADAEAAQAQIRKRIEQQEIAKMDERNRRRLAKQ